MGWLHGVHAQRHWSRWNNLYTTYIWSILHVWCKYLKLRYSFHMAIDRRALQEPTKLLGRTNSWEIEASSRQGSKYSSNQDCTLRCPAWISRSTSAPCTVRPVIRGARGKANHNCAFEKVVGFNYAIGMVAPGGFVCARYTLLLLP